MGPSCSDAWRNRACRNRCINGKSAARYFRASITWSRDCIWQRKRSTSIVGRFAWAEQCTGICGHRCYPWRNCDGSNRSGNSKYTARDSGSCFDWCGYLVCGTERYDARLGRNPWTFESSAVYNCCTSYCWICACLYWGWSREHFDGNIRYCFIRCRSVCGH